MNTVIVYAHDAGGAMILASYIRAQAKKTRFRVFALGPAVRIFRTARIPLASRVRTPHAVLRDARRALTDSAPTRLLCGTGGAPRHELDLIRAARAAGVHTAAFLDHWVYYRERFGAPSAGWRKNLPDEIWVGDREAERRASALLGRDARIRFVSNPYFADIRRQARPRTSRTPNALLFISEPVGPRTIHAEGYSEKDFLTALLAHRRTHWPHVRVTIRLHPSERRTRYQTLLRGQDARVTVSPASRTLVDDLSRAFLVVGMESMALVIAGMCGKTVMRFLSKHRRSDRLPIPGTAFTSREKLLAAINTYVQPYR
ncbi:MAG: hypothetical protein RL141_910 [Candidatus Parcubacteria bacterium]|jgi:hypothetical protein